MKIFKKVFLVFISVISYIGIVYGANLIFYPNFIKADAGENTEQGIVLGAAESAALEKAREIKTKYFRFPEAEITRVNTVIIPQKKDKAEKPEIGEGRGAVVDVKSGKILFGKEESRVSSVASLTKLMTALIFMEKKGDLDGIYIMRAEDRVDGGKAYLFEGEEVRTGDLLHLSLIGSANTATAALTHASGLSEAEFVAEMNKKAKAMGLKNTHFADPVGLSDYNVSTPLEMTRVAMAAFEHEKVREILRMPQYEFYTLGGRKKVVYNTDILLAGYPLENIDIIGGKTGYTPQAGYCFLAKFRDNHDNEIIAVVLGSENINSRFATVEKMAKWAYDSYIW